MKSTVPSDDRFQRDARKYAAYLESAEGRLRQDLAFANVHEFLSGAKASLHALDIGGGTGTTAVRLARLGIHVTLLDSSPAMLAIAEGAALDAGIGDNISLKHGDAAHLASLFPAESFDLILCHNVLEYVEAPAALLGGAARLLRGSLALFSIVVRNHPGEVLKAAIQTGDLAAAERALNSDWAEEALYGGKVRLFSLETIREMLRSASVRVIAERGLRVITDYLPPRVHRTEEYERILELERKMGARPEFTAVARYTQTLASPGSHQDADE